MNDLAKEFIEEYCKSSGAITVWQTWRNTMLKQHRDVAEERMNWFSLPDIDKSLDADIAYAVVKDFLFWLNSL